MKIAIIGGTGSIGTHVARELSRNQEVIICDIVRPRLMGMKNGIMFRHCDVLDSNSCNDALVDIDVVFHKVGLMGGVLIQDNSIIRVHESFAKKFPAVRSREVAAGIKVGLLVSVVANGPQKKLSV